ncbi:MAG: hypothetical protein LBR24_03955 [Methanobrevibacter sp.]|nr:hypothetical protein [Methanobrevibacter sp.]
MKRKELQRKEFQRKKLKKNSRTKSEKCCDRPQIIQEKNVLFCKKCGVVITEQASSRKQGDGRNSSRHSVLPRGDDYY